MRGRTFESRNGKKITDLIAGRSASSLHLDILRDLRRIHSHICSVAYPVLEAAGELAPRENATGEGRVPFLLSIVMVAVGLYIRLGILETPAFQRVVAENRIERAPVWEVIKRQPKEIILSALARTAEQAPAYIYLAFVFAYGTQVLHAPRNFLLTSLIAAGVLSFVTIPVSGHLSDRIGRRRMYL